MKYEIKNGLLILANTRIILARVAQWRVDGSTIIFVCDGMQISLNVGPDAPRLDAELLKYFTDDYEKEDGN